VGLEGLDWGSDASIKMVTATGIGGMATTVGVGVALGSVGFSSVSIVESTFGSSVVADGASVEVGDEVCSDESVSVALALSSFFVSSFCSWL